MKHLKIRSWSWLALLVGLLAFGGGQARAAALVLDDDHDRDRPTLTVDDDHAQCPNAQFTRIQDAVNAAPAGATIKVCPGTYVEQVTIPAGKNGLTLISSKPLEAIIKAPAVMTSPKAIVRVNGAKDVTITRFTITGPGGGSCDSIEYGVRVDGGGSATITSNHITKIHDTPFSGCQNGFGVDVGSAAAGQSGKARIIRNIIDRYQKGGVVVDGANSSAEVTDNEVTGIGPTAVIAQNGIQVSRGATASVERNEVSDNVYTPQSVVSTGILLDEAGKVNISSNEVTHNDVNIFSFNTANPVIAHNRSTNATFDGIALVGTTKARVADNVARNNGEDGIFVDETSMNNLITGNRLRGNANFDAEDLSTGGGSCGTANTWQHNQCQTDNKGGCLCSNDHTGDDEDKGDDDNGRSASAPATKLSSVHNGAVNRAISPGL